MEFCSKFQTHISKHWAWRKWGFEGAIILKKGKYIWKENGSNIKKRKDSWISSPHLPSLSAFIIPWLIHWQTSGQLIYSNLKNLAAQWCQTKPVNGSPVLMDKSVQQHATVLENARSFFNRQQKWELRDTKFIQ